MIERLRKVKKTIALFFWSVTQSFKVSPVLFILGSLASIVLSVFFIIYSKLEGDLIDSFSRVPDGISLVFYSALALLLFSVFRDILNYLNGSLLSAVLREKQERYYTRLFLHHYSNLDIGRIEQPEFQDLKNKVSDRGLWNLRRLPDDISQFVGRFVALLFGAGIIFVIHPLAATVVILGTIPSFIIEIFYSKKQRQVWDKLTPERRSFWSMRSAFESKRTIQELIISNKSKVFLDRMDKYLDKEYALDFGVEKKFIIPNIFVKIVETASIGVGIYFIIMQAFDGALSIGQVVFSLGVLYSINSSLSGVVRGITDLNAHIPYLENVRDYFNTKPLIALDSKPIKLTKEEKLKISFENVSFKYPEKEEYVLKNISFTINSGEKVALVGLNGAGKTTIIKLLLRMYDPVEGRIVVNGVDLKKVNLLSWYESLGVLLQDFSRYEFLSIKDAIKLFARRKITNDEIHELLKKVKAESLVQEAKEGIDLIQSTEYGGKELSGGQFQKVAIARTLSRDADFIILDEPTGSIDALSEESIFKSLNNLPENITLLFISHRFTTIRNANHILIINEGTVTEEGTHQELLDNDKLYAQMYRSQVLGEA